MARLKVKIAGDGNSQRLKVTKQGKRELCVGVSITSPLICCV